MSQPLHYLYLCTTGLTAVRMQSRQILDSRDFSPEFRSDDKGQSHHAALSEWLAQHRRDRFIVIIDMVEEEFSTEQIPGLRRFDQLAVIKRRLQQRFRDTRLSQWSQINEPRSKGFSLKRKAPAQHRVLMSAISREQSLLAWLSVFEASRIAVLSVISPALLAQRLLQLRLKTANGLVVSEAPGGLRQTLIVDGEIRFSRLANNLKQIDLATLQSECLRTIQYLLMSQQISRDTLRDKSMPIWVLDGGIAGLAHMPARLAIDNAVELPFNLVRVADSADAASPNLGALPAWCEIEQLGSLGRSHPRGYADAGLLHAARVRSARLFLVRGGFASLGLGLTALSLSLGLRWFWPAETLELRVRMDRANTEQTKLRREMEHYAIKGPEMRRVVELSRAVRQRHVDPLPMMRHLADGLAADHPISVEMLRWKRIEASQSGEWTSIDLVGKSNTSTSGQGGTPGSPLGGTPGSPLGGGPGSPLGGGPGSPLGGSPGLPGSGGAFGQAPLSASALPALPGQGPASGPAGPATGEGVGPIVLELKASLGLDTAMQAANEQAQALAKRLGERCGCEVTVTQLPFDTAAASGFNKTYEQREDRDRKPPMLTLRMLYKDVPQAPGRAATSMAPSAPMLPAKEASPS